MATEQLVALGGIDNTMPDALGAYQKGVQARQNEGINQIDQAQKTAELLGSGALYAMGGKLDGEVDPQKYNEVLDTFQNMGLDVGKYRGNPNYAKVLGNAAVTYFQRANIAHDVASQELAARQLQEDIRYHTAEMGIQKQNADTNTQYRTDQLAADKDTVDQVVQGIGNGTLPPDTQGLYRYGAKVKAGLAAMGFDLTKAQTEYQATKRHMATMNGPQFTKMRANIDTLSQSLDKVDELATKWDSNGWNPLNAKELESAARNDPGFGWTPEQVATATALKDQINNVTAELAGVYMGGNSPTDHAIDLAKSALSADWTKDQLKAMIKLAKENIRYRQNAMDQVGTQGIDSRYDPAPSAPAPAAGGGGWTVEEQK